MEDLSLSLQSCCSEASPVLVCHFMAATRPFSTSQKSTKASGYRWEKKYQGRESKASGVRAQNWKSYLFFFFLNFFSLSDGIMSELHRHTMIPSTPGASCGWWHTLLPTLEKLWMNNSVWRGPNRSYPSWATETMLVKFWRSQRAQSGNPVFMKPASTVWTALIQPSALIQTLWLQPEGREGWREGGRETGEDRIGRKGGMEGKRRGTFPPLTGIYSSAVLFTSPVVLLWRSGGGLNYWAMFLFFEVLLL